MYDCVQYVDEPLFGFGELIDALEPLIDFLGIRASVRTVTASTVKQAMAIVAFALKRTVNCSRIKKDVKIDRFNYGKPCGLLLIASSVVASRRDALVDKLFDTF